MDAGRFLKACAANDFQQVSHMLMQLAPGDGVGLLVQGLAVAKISGATSVAELLRPVVQRLTHQPDSGPRAASADGTEVRATPVGQGVTMQQTAGVPADDDSSGEPIPAAATGEPGPLAPSPSPPLEALFRADALTVVRRLRDLADAIDGVDLALVTRAIASVRAAVERGDSTAADDGILALRECRAEALLVYLALWETPSGKRPLPSVLLGGARADDVQRLLTKEWPSLAGQLSAASASVSRDTGDA